MKNKDKKCCKTYIGGQAVLEGVMMRGKSGIATAVRDADGIIRLEAERLSQKKSVFTKIPIIRGAINFFVSLVTGVKILMRSGEVYGEDSSAEPTKFEKWLSKTFKVDVMNVVMVIGVILGLALSIGLFFALPHFLGELFERYVTDSPIWRNIFEGALRIIIFVSYILLTSLIKDMKRTYMYHGAEHKTITCYEKGLPLTVENVRSCRRVHDRCGTTFMFFVMVVSIFVFTVLGTVFPLIASGPIRFLAKILLLPLVAGISYELLKLLAKTDSPLVYIFKLPGLLLQRITTKEPTDDMIEVAITSFNKVLKMDADENEPTCKFICPEKLSLVLNRVKESFKEKNIDESDAEWLVAEVACVKRGELGKEKTLSAKTVETIDDFAKARLTGKPLAYVLGNQNFYGFTIKVDERVLIPRPETEELVSLALKSIEEGNEVLDLCTGSGAIAIAVKKLSTANVTASDINAEALDLAKENAASNNAEITFVHSDMFEGLEGKFDVIISNPPYIATKVIGSLDDSVKDFEPHIALDGGEDGLKYYRIIAENADKFLKKGGKLFLEIGFDQAESVGEMLKEKYEVSVYKDISGNQRMVEAKLND